MRPQGGGTPRRFTDEEGEAICRRIEAGESAEAIAREQRPPVTPTTIRRTWTRYRGKKGVPVPSPFSATDKENIMRLHNASVSDRTIADLYGVHRSSIFRLHTPRPDRLARKRALQREPNRPHQPRPAVVPEPIHTIKARRRWVPLEEYLASRPPADPPLPVRPVESPVPGAPDRAAHTISNARAAHAVKELEALGWRAEAFPLGDGVSMIEVRDTSIRATPLKAKLRSVEDIAAFKDQNGRCPRRGEAPPEGVRVGMRPHREPLTEGHFPPRASLAIGRGRVTADIDY